MDSNFLFVEWIMIGLAVFYVGMEIVLNFDNQDNNTSNIFLLEWSKGKYIFIPFGLGAVLGHLFLGHHTNLFPNRFFDSIPNEILVVMVLLLISGFLFLIGFLTKKKEKTTDTLVFLLTLGLLYGHFFWSMNY